MGCRRSCAEAGKVLVISEGRLKNNTTIVGNLHYESLIGWTRKSKASRGGGGAEGKSPTERKLIDEKDWEKKTCRPGVIPESMRRILGGGLPPNQKKISFLAAVS